MPKYRTEGLKVSCGVVVCAAKEKTVAYKATIIANKTRVERSWALEWGILMKRV